MKTKQILPWLMMFFIGMASSPVLAQSYDQLWKEEWLRRERFTRKQRKNATCLR